MTALLPSVYKEGTATVAANGVVVTGQGTMWLNTILPGDFFGTHKGSPNRILAVNSNTSLTLAYPWLGGAQATAAYEIMYQSDNARMLEAARQLLEKLSNGNVDALAGLAGGANKFPYFTGLGTMTQSDVTPFVRSNVMNKADRATLLAAGSGIDVSPNVNNVSRVSSNLNDEILGGWVVADSSITANTPVGGPYGFCLITPWANSNAAMQVYYAYGSSIPGQRWFRLKNIAGVWSAWTEEIPNAYKAVQNGGVTGADTQLIKMGWGVGGVGAIFGQLGTTALGKVWTDHLAPRGTVGAGGYQQLPTGMIIQWGYSTSTTVTYPVAFPSYTAVIVATIVSPSTAVVYSITSNTTSASGAVFIRNYTGFGGGGGGPAGDAFLWIAIGF